MANIPKQVPRNAGNLNDGQSYERKVLLFIAATLSQNEDVEDFWIVSNPIGIDKIDDVVVRISFKGNSRKDIALFVQAKLSKPDKILWLNMDRQKSKQKTSLKFEINLPDYEKAFNDLITSKKGKPEELYKLLEGVDVNDYFVCIFTNMKEVEPELEPKEVVKDDPVYFLDTGSYQYRQIHYESEKFQNKRFYKQLYICLGQASFVEIDFSVANLLGKDFVHRLENLDRTIKNFMQRGDSCTVLTKAEFEVQWFKVLALDWIFCDLEKLEEINPIFMDLWCKMFSYDRIINLGDTQTGPLLVSFYQYIIRELMNTNFSWHENQNLVELKELLFLLWRDKKLPLAIRADCTKNLLRFLDNFNTVERRFIVFSPDHTPEMITHVGQISDEQTLQEIMKVEVSLQGRPPVPLSDIIGHTKELFDLLKISQVLKWTKNGDCDKDNIIGPMLCKPDAYYIARRFTLIQDGEDEEQDVMHYFLDKRPNLLSVAEVVQLCKPGLHIITGEPGMGKSTVLQKLAYEYSPKDFVIYIALRDCLHDIENRVLLTEIQADPVRYFFNKMSDNTDDMAISIFNNHKNNKRLCVFLDGYDEILPLHGNKISLLLEDILKDTAFPVFCTTRPHGENQVAEFPDTITLELLPFDIKQIQDFMWKLWRNETGSIIQHFDLKFLNNPLHLNMISQTVEELGSIRNITIGKMYKVFFELKHKKYNEKIGISQNHAHEQTEKSMKNHRKLAMVDIFGMTCVTSQGIMSMSKFHKTLKQIEDHNIGIVVVLNGYYKFLHRTFAEYLVAEWLLRKVRKDISHTNSFKSIFQQIVCNHRDIYDMLNELSDNYLLWLQAKQSLRFNSDLFKLDEFGRNYFHVNYDDTRNILFRSRLFYRKDSVLQWTCSEYHYQHPNENGSAVIDDINKDYPTHTQLNLEHIDSCTKLLTAIDNENENDIYTILKTQQYLLDTGVGIVAFHSAITTGTRRIVMLLLDLRPTLLQEQDVNGNTALHIACACEHRDIVALLLEKNGRIDVRNKETWSPFDMAVCRHGELTLASLLLDHIRKKPGIDPQTSSTSNLLWKSLIISSELGLVDSITWLLDNGANPTLTNHDGWTVLHSAAAEDQSEIVRILTERGLDINGKSNLGETPLIIASSSGSTRTVQWLLKHGADVTLSNDNGWTAMHFAAKEGRTKVVRLLLNHGVYVNPKTKNGETPLAIVSQHRRRYFNNCDIVKLLVDHGGYNTFSYDNRQRRNAIL